MKVFSKLIAALTAALAVAGSLLADGDLSTGDICAIAAAFLGAYGVYQLTNAAPGQ